MLALRKRASARGAQPARPHAAGRRRARRRPGRLPLHRLAGACIGASSRAQGRPHGNGRGPPRRLAHPDCIAACPAATRSRRSGPGFIGAVHGVRRLWRLHRGRRQAPARAADPVAPVRSPAARLRPTRMIRVPSSHSGHAYGEAGVRDGSTDAAISASPETGCDVRAIPKGRRHFTSGTRVEVASRWRPITVARRSASRALSACTISSCSATAPAHLSGASLPTMRIPRRHDWIHGAARAGTHARAL